MKIAAASEPLRERFDDLVDQVICGSLEDDDELPWLSDYLTLHWAGEIQLVAYLADQLKDFGFSDEHVSDRFYPEEVEITDALRIESGRHYLTQISFSDSMSLFDPGFVELEIESSAGKKATVIMAFFGMGQTGLSWTVIGGYEEGNLVDLINEAGYLTEDQLAHVSDQWVLDHWGN